MKKRVVICVPCLLERLREEPMKGLATTYAMCAIGANAEAKDFVAKKVKISFGKCGNGTHDSDDKIGILV